MEVTITRAFEIDYGHRLARHESKCRNVHGHRGRFEVTLRAKQLDAVGRVIDFGRAKELLGGWLDVHWDHGFIVQDDDPLVPALKGFALKLYIVNVPPSAEHLARLFYDVAVQLLPEWVQVLGVRCYETPNCWADYQP